MVEKGIRAGICHAIHQYAKANTNTSTSMVKIKTLSYLKYWDVNNLYGWAMSQKLPVNDYKWVKDISEFNEDFRKSYNNNSDEGFFLDYVQYVQYSANLHNPHTDVPFLRERMKIEKAEKLVASLLDKTLYQTEYLIHIRNLKQA